MTQMSNITLLIDFRLSKHYKISKCLLIERIQKITLVIQKCAKIYRNDCISIVICYQWSDEGVK